VPKVPQFNPEEFFHFAGAILKNSAANEAELHSAISRVYYSLFLVARNRMFGIDEQQLTDNIRKRILRNYRIKIGKGKSRLGMHERVIFAIRDRTNNITLSQQLDQLREARINADYKVNQKCLSDIGKKSWREYAEESMQLASLALARVKNLPSY